LRAAAGTSLTQTEQAAHDPGVQACLTARSRVAKFWKCRRRASLAVALAVAASALAAPRAQAAPAAPAGAHPRIFLSTKVRDAFKAAAADPKSAVSALIARCQKAIDMPASLMTSGYQGDSWSFTASGCALAWQLTGDAKYAAPGVLLWRALLEDVATLGDKKACVAGAAMTAAIASVKRDTGYAIRFIGPHSALVYDWMHDAPGVTPALLQQTRDCFRQWITNYTTAGYLHDQPGANYHAGFVAAKTLISIAEGGEDGANSDAFWTQVVDDVFAKQLIGNGLAVDTGGIPTGNFQGAILGGDWPEGWQYGPLSVLEYAYSTRALQEQGVTTLDPMAAWTSSLALRMTYGLTPDRTQQYVGGDTEAATAFAAPTVSPLDATLLGASSDETAGWAKSMEATVFKPGARDTVWQALADTRVATAADPTLAKLPLWYLARGPRNLYARSAWTADAFWAVFTSAPRLVADHQHPDASNFVFVRGSDALVVDPSPYADRSTLTGNALAIDTGVVKGDYSPSQTQWSKADMPFARGTMSGVVAARGDIAQAFWFTTTASDVKLARRDWVFLPEGELVAVDRATTADATRKVYLRFRTPGTLTAASASPFIARADVGLSSLAIHAVKLVPATAPVLRATTMASDCGTTPFGSCRISRSLTQEYSWEPGGPDVLAVHVLDGLAKGDAPADVAPIDAAPIDTSPAENAGVVGASVYRAQKQTFVVEPATLPAPATLSYGVPGANPSRHVVFDAPADATGHTAVTATAKGDRCELTLTAGAGVTAAPAIFTLSAASDGCKVSEDADVAAGTVSPGSGGFERPGGGGPAGGGTGAPGGTGAGGTSGGGTSGGGTSGVGTGGGVSGGCSCRAAGVHPGGGLGALGLTILALLVTRRRRAAKRKESV
jgi:MYXO-CTERM domain-containing protein